MYVYVYIMYTYVCICVYNVYVYICSYICVFIYIYTSNCFRQRLNFCLAGPESSWFAGLWWFWSRRAGGTQRDQGDLCLEGGWVFWLEER